LRPSFFLVVPLEVLTDRKTDLGPDGALAALRRTGQLVASWGSTITLTVDRP